MLEMFEVLLKMYYLFLDWDPRGVALHPVDPYHLLTLLQTEVLIYCMCEHLGGKIERLYIKLGLTHCHLPWNPLGIPGKT